MAYKLKTDSFALAWMIFKRDFFSMYRRTVFGPLLAFIAPAVYLAVFIFFRLMFGLPEAKGIPMIPFLFSGIAMWMFFSAILSGVYPSITSNMGILRKMPVNPMIFAFSSLGLPLVTCSVYVFLLLILSTYYGIVPSLTWLYLPFLVALIGFFGMGLGLFVCTVGIYRRDIIYLLPIILQLGMFVTPIFFPPEIVPTQFQWAVRINPMAHLIGMFRDALFLETSPRLIPLAISLGMTVFIWCVGYPLFRRTMRYAADTI